MPTTLANFGVPLGPGIPMPAVKHKFRVCFRESDIFARSIVSVNFDYIRKTIMLDVREDPQGEIHAVIHGLRPWDIFLVEVLDGGEGALRTMVFTGLELQEARSGFDYRSSEPVTQYVEMSYAKMQVTNGPLIACPFDSVAYSAEN